MADSESPDCTEYQTVFAAVSTAACLGLALALALGLLVDTSFTCRGAAFLALTAAAMWTFGVEAGRTAAVLADPDMQTAATTPTVATPAATAGTAMDRRRLERAVDGCW